MSDRAKASYVAFIDKAAKHGLPIRFLERVARGYTFEETSDENPDSANPVTNTLKLRTRTISLFERFPSGETDIGGGLDGVFHESAHAFIDLMENSAPYKDFVTRGKDYYKDAPLKNGSTASDSSRLFNEAVGEYVGNRLGAWFAAYSDITFVISRKGKVPEDKLQKLLAKALHKYEKEMAKLEFGYVEKTHWFSANENLWTSKPLSEEMKQFLDSRILEGRIPDKFSDVSEFRRMLKKAGISLPKIPLAGQEETTVVPHVPTPTPTPRIVPKQNAGSSAATKVHEQLELIQRQQRELLQRQRGEQTKRRREPMDRMREESQRRIREQMDRMRENRRKMEQERQQRDKTRRQGHDRTEKERRDRERNEKTAREQQERQRREQQRANVERVQQERERRERVQREQERQRVLMRARPITWKPHAIQNTWQPYRGKTGAPGSMGYPVGANTGNREAPGFPRPIPGLGGKAWEHDRFHGD